MSSLSTEISLDDVKFVTIVLPSVAILVTSLRILDRARMRKLWWDDAWAFMSMVFMIIFMVAVLLHIRDPATLPRGVKIGVYYMCAQFFYTVVWSSRISILLTVIRICPNGPTRTFLSFVALAFAVVWIILFAQVWWVCETEPSWKNDALPQCALGEKVAIAQVITDVISDTILIFTPIQLIRGVRLSRTRKIQLISVFSTTSVMTIVSLYHAFAVLRVGGFYEANAAVIESSIGLIIANLTVIVALLMRITHHEEEENDQNRRPLFLHSVGTRRRNRRADPLQALSTFEGTFGGIKTTIETDIHDGKGSGANDTKEALDSRITKKLSPFGGDADSENNDMLPQTFELANLSHAEQSRTLVNEEK